MWGAVGGAVVNNNTQYEIAVSVHDSVYNTDFASLVIAYNPNSPEKNAKEIEQAVPQTFRKFSIVQVSGCRGHSLSPQGSK